MKKLELIIETKSAVDEKTKEVFTYNVMYVDTPIPNFKLAFTLKNKSDKPMLDFLLQNVKDE